MKQSRKRKVFSRKKEKLSREIDATALMVAERKEKLASMQALLEKNGTQARENLERVKALQRAVFLIVSLPERTRTRRELQEIEREIRDFLFSIAQRNSEIRRMGRLLAEAEKKITKYRGMVRETS